MWVVCPICKGAGDVEVDPKNPYLRTKCTTCNGDGGWEETNSSLPAITLDTNPGPDEK